MHQLKSFLHNLKAYDLVVVVFFTFLTTINIIFHSRIELWLNLLILNLCVITFAFFLAFMEEKFENKFWVSVHYWYIAPLILITFKELNFLIRPIRVADYDLLFIKIDRFILHTDPTRFLAQLSFPLLTEILQIIYGMFYFLPIILAIALLRKKRYVAMDYAVFIVIYGFYLSYLGYFALPGIGPRFTLHNFANINNDLPGLFLTNFVREMVNLGESLTANTPNPAAVVQRDVFPSGHTMLTLIVMYLSVKLKSRSKYFLVPVGTLLIFSTVYLWYHYVIDLVGGALLMIFCVWSGKYIFNWWRRKVGKPEFEYGKY